MTYNKIHHYSTPEQLDILREVCGRIYIARNISLCEDSVIEQLQRIDSLFRDTEYEEEPDDFNI